MSAPQGIVKGDPFQRLTSAALVIGACLLLVFNILAPRPADPTDLQASFTNMVNRYSLFQLSHLMLAAGFWAVMAGLAGVDRSISEKGAAWARIGFLGIIVGTALFTITMAFTATEASSARAWAAASGAEEGAAFAVTVATVNVGKAAYIMSILLYWLSLAFVGVGMARSGIYPGWLAWAPVALGVAMTAVVGVPQFMVGDVRASSMLIFAGLAGLTTVWLLAAGIWIARRAW